MRQKKTYLWVLGFGLLLWIFGLSNTGAAQPTLGVVWDNSEENPITDRQLQLFEDIGVTHIEFPAGISEDQIRRMDSLSFSILIRNDERFYTLRTLEESAEEFGELNREMLQTFEEYNRIAGFGLLSQSHFKDPDFSTAFEEKAESLNTFTDKTLYYVQNRQWVPLNSTGKPFGRLINDAPFNIEDLSVFDTHMQDHVEESDNLILFLHSKWLTQAVEDVPEFASSLKVYHEEGHWSFPMPYQEEHSSPANWLVFALLLLWIVLAVQVKFIPNARPMVLRYFFAHRFYVDDILHYRERYATQSIIMMVVHALSGGIVVFVASKMLISELGMNALTYHLPWLDWFNNGYISLSIFMIVLILLFQTISIFWLYFPAKNLRNMSQTANLYAGLLYTDYLTLTILISFYVTGFSAIPVTILATFYLLIWFINFYLTAFNTARNQTSDKILYFILTSGLHTVINLSIIVYLILQTDIIDILRLSLSL